VRLPGVLDGRDMGLAPAPVLAGQLNLPVAWEQVAKKSGMAGVDGVVPRRFAGEAAMYLRELESMLARGSYKPLPLRLMEISKRAGARRRLMVPCVADRVVQTGAAGWLGLKWNSAFDGSSFAYRPGLGVADALRALRAQREKGLRWVLRADIASFFDSIDHGRLSPEGLRTYLRAYEEAMLGRTGEQFEAATEGGMRAILLGQLVGLVDTVRSGGTYKTHLEEAPCFS